MSTPVVRGDGSTTAGSRSVLRRRYGASPWHLVALLGCFALSAYTASRLLGEPALLRIAIWFVGAAVVWDLVLGPAFALLDRLLQRGTGRLRAAGVPVLNFVRVPAALSLLLLLVWAPLVLQRSQDVYAAKTGLSQDPYLGRWLAVTVALFAGSAALLALTAVRRARR